MAVATNVSYGRVHIYAYSYIDHQLYDVKLSNTLTVRHWSLTDNIENSATELVPLVNWVTQNFDTLIPDT